MPYFVVRIQSDSPPQGRSISVSVISGPFELRRQASARAQLLPGDDYVVIESGSVGDAVVVGTTIAIDRQLVSPT